MITIQLNNLLFFSHHGVDAEETVVGTEFELNVSVSFNETGRISTLDQTVNYVALYNIIADHMKKPSRLLETVAMDIADDISKSDKRINTINICISKLNPPINNFTGNVGVIYNKVFTL
jgi:dihydroneopterin aldolase